ARIKFERAAVDVDLAGADPSRDFLRTRFVHGPDRAGEAVGRVVGDANRLVLILVAEVRAEGPEDLLLRDVHRVFTLAEDGRLDEVAASDTLGLVGAAGQEFCA